MRPYAKSFLTTGVLLISVGLWAQEVYHADDTDLLARLSYDHSAIVHGEDVRQVCIAVSRDGEYRIMRSLTTGEMQRLQGKLPQEQLQQLKTLLKSTELKGPLREPWRPDSSGFGKLCRRNSTQRWSSAPALVECRRREPVSRSRCESCRLAQTFRAQGCEGI